jgi:hypothetical protein
LQRGFPNPPFEFRRAGTYRIGGDTFVVSAFHTIRWLRSVVARPSLPAVSGTGWRAKRRPTAAFLVLLFVN